MALNQLVAGLLSPEFSKGMFKVGQSLGGAVDRNYAAGQDRIATQIINDALSSNDPEVILNASRELNQMNKTKESLMLAGKARELANKRAIANLGISGTSSDRLKGEQFAREAAEMTRVRLEKAAVNLAKKLKGKSDEEKEALVAGLYGESEENLRKFLSTGGKGALGKTFAKGGDFIDEKGNRYALTIERDKQGGVTPLYTPVTPGAPETPIGKLTPVGGAYSETAAQKSERTVEESADVQIAEDFSKLKVQAAGELPELLSQRKSIEDAMTSLDSIKTEGIPASVANLIQSELGFQDPDVAEYELLVGELMYKRLKPLFGGVISEGEREAIQKLYNNLKRGNPANKAILTQLKKKIDESITKSNLIRNSKDYKEYNQKLDKFFVKPEKQEDTDEDVVDWADMQ